MPQLLVASAFSATPIIPNTAAIIEKVSTSKIYDNIYTLNIFNNFTFYDELFSQIDKNTNVIKYCLQELQDKNLPLSLQNQLYIASMTRTLMRHTEFLLITEKSSTRFYTNQESCSTISSAQLVSTLAMTSTDIHKSNIFTYTLEPTPDNIALLTQSRETSYELKLIRENIDEMIVNNISAQNFYDQLKNTIHESILISESTLMQIYYQNVSLTSNLLNIINIYDILKYNNKTFNEVWQMISEISNFSCQEHEKGRITSIEIPLITGIDLVTSLFQATPIILLDHTLQLKSPQTWIVGNINEPTYLLNNESFFQHCHPKNDIFLCKFPPKYNPSQDPCINALLTKAKIYRSCELQLFFQATCISQTMGYNKSIFAHFCPFAKRSWILPIKRASTSTQFIQLTNMQILLLNNSNTEVISAPIHHNNILPLLALGSIAITAMCYLTAWACVLYKSFHPHFIAH